MTYISNSFPQALSDVLEAFGEDKKADIPLPVLTGFLLQALRSFQDAVNRRDVIHNDEISKSVSNWTPKKEVPDGVE